MISSIINGHSSGVPPATMRRLRTEYGDTWFGDYLICTSVPHSSRNNWNALDQVLQERVPVGGMRVVLVAPKHVQPELSRDSERVFICTYNFSRCFNTASSPFLTDSIFEGHGFPSLGYSFAARIVFALSSAISLT